MKRAKSKSIKRQILLVDDHPMTRQGLSTTIRGETDLDVCGEAEDARQAMEMVKTARPDLLLLDISMPGKNGLEIIKDLRVMHPDVPVLVVSMHDESLYAERVLRAGAGGYINKQQRPAVLIKAIREVLAGRTYVSHKMSEKILKLFSGRSVATTSPLEILKDREFEVIRHIGQGSSTAEIAKRLNLSAKTVAVHYANIRRKLQVGTYSDLIRLAVRLQEGQNLSQERRREQ